MKFPLPLLRFQWNLFHPNGILNSGDGRSRRSFIYWNIKLRRKKERQVRPKNNEIRFAPQVEWNERRFGPHSASPLAVVGLKIKIEKEREKNSI